MVQEDTGTGEGGGGGYHFSYLSPNNQPPLYQDGHFLSSALPSWRSDHLRQDQLQQLNIRVGKNKKPTLETIKIYISLNPAVHIFMNGGEWYEAAAIRPHTFFPGFAFLIIPAAPPQWKYKYTCNVQRLTVQFVGPH